MPAESSQSAKAGREPLKVFGLKNCDTCREAVKWLESQKLPFRFHDVREGGINAGLLKLWCASPFANLLVNRRSTTWRSLSGQQRAAALADPGPVLQEHPTLLKRPVIMEGRHVVSVGFYPADLEKRLK